MPDSCSHMTLDKSLKDVGVRDVAVPIIYRENKVCLVSKHSWKGRYEKFPQGGIRTWVGESIEENVRRELFEELGLFDLRAPYLLDVHATFPISKEARQAYADKGNTHDRLHFAAVSLEKGTPNLRAGPELSGYRWERPERVGGLTRPDLQQICYAALDKLRHEDKLIF